MKRLVFVVMGMFLLFCESNIVFAERSVNDAINWAKSKIGRPDWVEKCFIFVRTSYGETSVPGIEKAIDGWNGGDNIFGEKHTSQDYNSIPKGALVFFDSYPPYGHIGLSIGNGRMIHAWIEKVEESNISDSQYADHYLGWRWPEAWTDDEPVVPSPCLIYFRAGNLAWYPSNASCINAERWIYFNCGYPNGGMSVGDCSICYEKQAEVIQSLGLGSDWWQILFGTGDIDQYKVCSH